MIVSAPDETGGRRAHSLHDLTVFLQHADLVGLDEVDVANSDVIEWHGGGPEVWPAAPAP